MKNVLKLFGTEFRFSKFGTFSILLTFINFLDKQTFVLYNKFVFESGGIVKASIYTLGCKVNSYESEYIASSLKNAGYLIVPFGEVSDIVVINTCSVTNQADAKSRKIINQAVRLNPNACIVACGCFIEANKDIKIDGVDIYLGNKDKSRIVELVSRFFESREEIRRLYSNLGDVFENMEISSFEGKTRAFVKVQDGCENFCTYCIIPYVRGKCRSKDLEQVVREITDLVSNGYKEVVLTGIHTGNYGVDLNTNFASLLKRIICIPGLLRVRVSSIEITELTDEVLDILENSSSVVANHLHIPLQAGSNHVLKLMNRKYDLDYFREKINKIRAIRPDISISTDIIVGFPGETDEDFESTLNFAREINFSKIHVFPYSKRKGTPAAVFKEQVDEKVKKMRAKKLIDESRYLEEEYMKQFIGSNLELLVETEKDGFSYGHTSNYLHCKILGKFKSGMNIKVKAVSVEYPYLIVE